MRTKSLEGVVESALRDALGWQPNRGEIEAFVAAVTPAFRQQLRESSEWPRGPHSHSVQADLGSTLTGAQAGLYDRARASVEAATLLLDALAARRPGATPHEVGALRAVVRHELTELVTELGMPAGPRVARLDFLFELLLGEPSQAASAEIGGLLGALRDAYGLTTDAITTVEEGQTVTNLVNFGLVADYIRAIRQRWEAARSFFHRGSDAYVGVQLARVSRGLGVVAESVAETRVALESLGLGTHEREVLTVELAEGPLTLGELLDWIGRFAGEEGPLLADGGKVGAVVLATTAARLTAVLRAARPRLRVLIESVGDQMDRIERDLERVHEDAMLIADEPSPSIDEIFPAQGMIGDQVNVSISGGHFAVGADARLIRPGFLSIWSSNAAVMSSHKVIASLDLSGASPGVWDMEVLNPPGGSAVLPGGFFVLSAK
jgi:hypothetical protein